MELSTISIKDIIPEATRAIERYTKRSDPNVTLFKYDTHLSTEDLVMDTVEKVISANPNYLTKTYVWLAAKSVCINRMQKKKLLTVPAEQGHGDPEGQWTPLEETIPGDTADILADIYEYIVYSLGEEEQFLLNELIEGRMYVEIAEKLGISLRTMERRVHELKWKIEFLLTEEDPDVSPLVF